MPADVAVIQDVMIGAMIIAIMLSVGLDLTLDRFVVVFSRPGLLGGGLLVNHVLVPAAAFGVSLVLGLSPAVTAGLLLVAAAPGGPTGTLLVLHARGQLALSVSLIVVMNLINTTTTPLTLNFLGIGDTDAGSAITLGSMAKTIALYQLLPLSIGMTTRRIRPQLADRALPIASKFSKFIFGAVFIGMTVTQGHRVLDIGLVPLLAVELVVVVSLLLGGLIPGASSQARATVSLNSGVRNLALSLLLATLWFDDGATLLTVMIYGLLMLVNGVPLSFWWRRRLA